MNDQTDNSAFDAIAAALTAAWNAADGAAFARQFAEDADFVNIFAMYGRGRDAIAANHHMIFTTVYKGTRNTFTVTHARRLGDAALVHIAGEMHVPHGPMAGELRSLATAVVVRDGDAWKIAAFHNTKVVQPPPLAPPT